MRILLISPNRLRFPYPVYPLGLDYVAGALSHKHEVRILDLCPLQDEEVEGAVTEAIRGFQPDAIGVSVRNVDNTDATNLKEFVGEVAAFVQLVKRKTKVPVVLGGAGFTLYPREILDTTGADYGLVGEGERAAGLFDSLAAGSDPEGLPAVARRGGPIPPLAPLPAGPGGARRDLLANPALPFYLTHGGILNLQTQRGCMFHCVYCTYPVIEGNCPRRRLPDEVAAEAVALQSAGARYLFLADSVFNGDPSHCLGVAAAFRRAGLSIPWGAYFAPLSPPEGFYYRMAEAGCRHVEFGTEALSDVMLRRIRKGFGRADCLSAHRAARQAGINVAHFLILGGPDESDDTINETFDGAEELDDGVLFFFCGMRIFRNTELARMAIASGLIEKEASLIAPIFYEPRELSLTAIEARLRARAAGRPNWIVGSGDQATRLAVEKLYAAGHAGPLWEYLVNT